MTTSTTTMESTISPPTKTKKTILPLLTELQHYATKSQLGHDEFRNCQWQLTKSRQHASSMSSGGVIMTQNTSYVADFVREELRARYQLYNNTVVAVSGDEVVHDSSSEKKKDDGVDGQPGELIDEQKQSIGSEHGDEDSKPEIAAATNLSTRTRWEIKDVVEYRRDQLRQRKLNDAANDSSPSDDDVNDANSGLRQRKQSTKSPKSSSSSIPVPTTSSSEEDGSWTIVQDHETEGYDDDAELYLDDDEKRLFQKDTIELFGVGGGGGLKSSRDLKVAQAQAQQALKRYVEAANHAATILSLLNQVQS